LDHRQPDRIPVDFGGTPVSGIHATCVLALRDYFGLEKKPVKVIDPGQLLGEIDEDLKLALGVDTEGVYRRMTRFGFPAGDWKPYRLYGGEEVLVPGGFNVTIDERGDTLCTRSATAGTLRARECPTAGTSSTPSSARSRSRKINSTRPTTWKSTDRSPKRNWRTWSVKRAARPQAGGP
jgi:hypothetical protein